jgi:hypothetical protein
MTGNIGPRGGASQGDERSGEAKSARIVGAGGDRRYHT